MSKPAAEKTFLGGTESKCVMTVDDDATNSGATHEFGELSQAGPLETSQARGHEKVSKNNGIRYVAAALILRGSTVLVCQRRKDQPMANKWEFPGGKIERGETPEQAVARELDEELSIRAEVGARVFHVRHTYRSGGMVDLQFYVVHRYEGELSNNIFQRMTWCELKDLPQYDFLAADAGLVRDLAAGKLL